MKIKKPATAAAPAVPAAAGGATIADRFKLDPVAPKGAKGGAKGGTTSKGAAMAALIAALVALATAAFLVYTLYAHFEFLGRA